MLFCQKRKSDLSHAYTDLGHGHEEEREPLGRQGDRLASLIIDRHVGTLLTAHRLALQALELRHLVVLLPIPEPRITVIICIYNIYNWMTRMTIKYSSKT